MALLLGHPTGRERLGKILCACFEKMRKQKEVSAPLQEAPVYHYFESRAHSRSA
jgi:hypothetical protein